MGLVECAAGMTIQVISIALAITERRATPSIFV